MGRIVIALAVVCVLVTAGSASAAGWTSSVSFSNVVASTPTTGGGYPDDAAGVPSAGTCGSGSFNANHSESWLAVQPGTENIVGASKFLRAVVDLLQLPPGLVHDAERHPGRK